MTNKNTHRQRQRESRKKERKRNIETEKETAIDTEGDRNKEIGVKKVNHVTLSKAFPWARVQVRQRFRCERSNIKTEQEGQPDSTETDQPLTFALLSKWLHTRDDMQTFDLPTHH